MLNLQKSFPFDVCDRTRTRQHTLHWFHACKKWHAPFLFMARIVWDIGTRKMKERIKTSNLTFDNFSCNSMYGFRIMNNSYFGVNTIISLAYNSISLLEPQQSNLSNKEAYLEPCQTSKIKCFAKMING